MDYTDPNRSEKNRKSFEFRQGKGESRVKMRFLNCIVYMAILGIACFPVGRILARIHFCTEKFPFRLTECEKSSGLYKKLKVHAWQYKIPDVSRVFSKIVPRKQIQNADLTARRADVMVNETCVAELTHWMLCFLGIRLLFIWPGIGGILVFLVYVVFGNLPFILVQRYNRPRLIKLRDALLKREEQRTPEKSAIRTLILSCNNGGGHNSVAEAIREMYCENGSTADIMIALCAP